MIGIFPSIFYQILPYKVSYQPYDFSHVLSQLQLLTFAAFAFICLWHFKIYPPELNSTVLNSDWFYRKMIPGVLFHLVTGLKKANIKFYSNSINICYKVKDYFSELMFENKIFDREAGFDTQIILQIFGIILFFIILFQFI